MHVILCKDIPESRVSAIEILLRATRLMMPTGTLRRACRYLPCSVCWQRSWWINNYPLSVWTTLNSNRRCSLCVGSASFADGCVAHSNR